MILTISRFVLKEWTFSDFLIDADKKCYILEDEDRGDDEKVWGKTAIPCGEYKVKFRKEGHIYSLYKERFKNIKNERGMLNIIGIKGFGGDVMFHCGNTILDTNGCPLFGMTYHPNEGTISESEKAYNLVYPIIADELEKVGEIDLIVKRAIP